MGALLDIGSRIARLTPNQQVAFNTLMEFIDGQGGMATLEGYAGTGKTFLVGEVVRTLDAQGRKVAIAAPTNKAVAVLREKVGVSGVHSASIHSLLGLRMKEKENGTQECVPDGDPSLEEYGVAIVDECSMISEEMFQRILFARGGCKIIFVGDPAQLPPVGDHLESPVFRDVKLKVRLSEIVRQAADNPIIGLSMKVRGAIEEKRRATALELSQSLPSGRSKAGFVPGAAQAVFDLAYHVAKSEGQNFRIVAYTNRQVKQYNARLHQALFGYTECDFAQGETVIAHEEFKAVDLMDEDGVWVSTGESVRIITSEELEVLAAERADNKLYGFDYFNLKLRRDNGAVVKTSYPTIPGQVESAVNDLWKEWRSIKASAELIDDFDKRAEVLKAAKEKSGDAWALKRAFAPLRHAYAITAHKSQGSTFHTVIVDWNDLSTMRRDFEFNRALYVACTRASDHLAIVV